MRCCGRRSCCADQSLTCNTCADPNANAGCHTCGRTVSFPKHQSAKLSKQTQEDRNAQQ